MAHIAQLEHKAIDSSHTHLALAAQHEPKVPSLHRAALHSVYGAAHSIAEHSLKEGINQPAPL